VSYELIYKGLIKDAKRIDIKIGSNVIARDDHTIDERRVEDIVNQVVYLMAEKGVKPTITTSGAGVTGKGCGALLGEGCLAKQQAYCAVGQGKLISLYDKYFSKHRIRVSQLLLTYETFRRKKFTRNFISTASLLIYNGIVPIINENDTVATDEITFGDNDKLSALVATNLNSDLLVLLTNVDGLYDYNNQRLVRIVTGFKGIEALVNGETSTHGKGGMLSKVQAAMLATRYHIPTIIARGNEERILERIMNGEQLGTIFLPYKTKTLYKRR
jgi:glutamate 5-kinase